MLLARDSSSSMALLSNPLQVLKWVEETVQAMKVHLLSSNHDGAQENKWEVPFDPSLREVTVSLSGPSPQIELSDPFGRCLQRHSVTRAFLCVPP